MLLFRKHFSQHQVWLAVFLLGAIAVLAIFFYKGRYEYPGGSSAVGMICGVIAALIIVFEVLLWPRKKLRRWRLGRMRTWAAAHIWLGLLTVPFAFAHGGFAWGGAVATSTMVLLLIVVSSGIFGLYMQNWLPRKMLRELPQETLVTQIELIAAQYVVEADALIASTSGEEVEGAGAEFWYEINPGKDPDSPDVVGVGRSIATMSGGVVITDLPPKKIARTGLLHNAYQEMIRQYLQHGKKSKSKLRGRRYAAEFFSDLRCRTTSEAHAAVDLLETWCDQRRQFDLQKRLHFWLHSWLAVHLPLSIALLLMLLIHVVVALKYSGIYSLY